MPISLSHLDEDPTVLYVHIGVNSSISAFETNTDNLDAVIRTHTGRVDLITTSDMDAPHGSTIPAFRRLFAMLDSHAHFQMHIVVPFIRVPIAELFTTTLFRIFRYRHTLIFADSIEEARRLIYQDRA